MQVFLNQYAEDVANGQAERIMPHHSAEFLQDGRDKKEKEVFWVLLNAAAKVRPNSLQTEAKSESDNIRG